MRRLLDSRVARWVLLALAVLAAGAVVLLAAPSAVADVYGNIAPAPQVTQGIFGRYPLANYQLDQYFPALKISVFSGVDASGVAPLIAFFIAQVVWLVTAFFANVLITIFTFCFSLDLLNGNAGPGSGALAPLSQAIHNIYAHTFGAPWLIAAFSLVALWAMWKALVQRRYSETAGALAVSLAYCVIGLAIVTQPQATIAPASRYVNETSSALLSLSSQGNLTSQAQAKQQTSDELFRLLVLQPWTVLEFGGVEHCVTETAGKTLSVAVRPLASDPATETALAARLETATEIHAGTKTCINNENKYAPHFLAYPFQSKDRNSEYEALEKADDADLPESDPAKASNTYPLGAADRPAAEASGKGGQYERLLLAFVIFAGELGAFLLLGSLAVSVILAAAKVLFYLALSPFALVLGVIPGRGHAFFRSWLSRLAGYLLRKVIYSVILVVTLTVCFALADATSNLGWLLAFLLQTGFFWTVLLNRAHLTNDLLAATVGTDADKDRARRLQSFYYTVRLARMAGLHRHRHDEVPSPQGRGRQAAPLHNPEEPQLADTPRGIEVPEPADAYTDQPIAGSEGGPPPFSPDPDEEPS